MTIKIITNNNITIESLKKYEKSLGLVYYDKINIPLSINDRLKVKINYKNTCKTKQHSISLKFLILEKQNADITLGTLLRNFHVLIDKISSIFSNQVRFETIEFINKDTNYKSGIIHLASCYGRIDEEPSPLPFLITAKFGSSYEQKLSLFGIPESLKEWDKNTLIGETRLKEYDTFSEHLVRGFTISKRRTNTEGKITEESTLARFKCVGVNFFKPGALEEPLAALLPVGFKNIKKYKQPTRLKTVTNNNKNKPM